MNPPNEASTMRVDSSPRCCCGRPDCAYLEHNNEALRGIERDLETAAKLGQALLNRHESYISESQLEHARLTAQISELEADRNSLQRANEKIVAENRDLLSQLEALNVSLESSDKHITKLEDLLQDCEEEVRRLNGLERKSKELEEKILEMERERIDLTRKIEDEGEDKRNTFRRWRDSERKLQELRDELDKIEWEAKTEKERHEEIIARLERERALERELGGAEGRLKGAAAVQSLNKGTGTTIVSHFVRDILQDNATLQAGIVELRELLQTSNEEVQNLREQILQHQPVESLHGGENPPKAAALDEEIDWAEPSTQKRQQEVHVHHHYHTKIKPKNNRTPTVRRHSRKRTLMSISTLATTPEASPTTLATRLEAGESSPIAPLNLYHPRPRKNRWSVQSAATGSSAISSYPSSPRSYYDRNSSIFDRIEFGEDSSRPTSPESAAGCSPNQFNWRFDKINQDGVQFDSFDVTSPTKNASDEDEDVSPKDEITENAALSRQLTPKASQILLQPDHANTDSDQTPVNHEAAQERIADQEPVEEMSSSPQANLDYLQIRPSLRRSASHSSLVSISGMDIHIAKREARPFTPLCGISGHFAQSPSFGRQVSSSQPLVTVTEFTASSINQSIESDPNTPESKKTLSSLEALSGLAGLPGKQPVSTPPQPSVLGQLVGGWVRGKWGIAPMKSTGDLRDQRRVRTEAPPPPLPPPISPVQAPLSTKAHVPSQSFSRTPGINQKGSIPGIWIEKRTPSEIHAKSVDEEGLREGLAE